LLAVLIGLQNLPEGFNAFRELHALKLRSARRTLLIMWSLVAIGPLAGLLGYFLLVEYPAALGAIMMFAAGGILYLIFQDIAPQSRLRRHWAPPLGAVLGFSLALFSEMLVRAP
jgi:ZIP family zinc transporter